MTIDVATGIAHILQREEIDWVSTFPVCKVNNALGREGVKLLMMRDDHFYDSYSSYRYEERHSYYAVIDMFSSLVFV